MSELRLRTVLEPTGPLAENPDLKQKYEDDAKRDETRTRRVVQALGMLREGKTRS